MAFTCCWFISPDLSDLLNAATEFLRSCFVKLLQFETVQSALAWVMAPGLLLLDEFGISPTGDWLLAAFLIGWLFWARFTRIVWFTLARPFGIATAEQYIFFRRLGLPWEKPYKGYEYVRRLLWQWRHGGTGARQYWAGFWTMASHPFDPATAQIPVGRLPLFQRFGLHMAVSVPDSEKSIAVIAQAGSGKSAWIAYWLGCLNKFQAACIFDMDGAFVNAFGALLQAAGHRVIKIDVDHINKTFPDGRWNPLHELTLAAKRHGNTAVSAFTKLLAEALIVEDSTTQPVFARTARIIVKILILYVWLVEADKSLVRVQQLLNRGLETTEGTETPFGLLLFKMADLPARYAEGTIDDGAGGAICNEIANGVGLLAGQSYDAGTDSPDNFRKTAIYQLDWISDANVVSVIGGESDISGESLKLTNAVCFIVSTLTDTQTRLAPLVRAFTMMCIYAFQRTEPEMKLRHPMLLILDEFPNLGRGLDICAVAAPGFRKYGLRLVVISQSVGLLRGASPDRYKEFLNQAACVIWLGLAPTDSESLQFLTEEVLGHCQRRFKVAGYHWTLRLFLRVFGVKGLPAATYGMRPEPLLTQQQAAAFLSRTTGQIIVTFEDGRPPWRLQRLLYWKELAVWKYAVHKGHGEVFLRRLTRRALPVFRWMV